MLNRLRIALAYRAANAAGAKAANYMRNAPNFCPYMYMALQAHARAATRVYRQLANGKGRAC